MSSQATAPRTVLELLRELPLCDEMESCSPGGIEAMAPLGRLETLGEGDLVFELGEDADELRFVVEGRIALFISDPSGQDHTVGTSSQGDLLGWSALRRPGATWTVSARAARSTRCLVFNGQQVRQLCADEPLFGYCLMKYAFEAVARRLTDARLQVLDVYGDQV